MPRRTHGDHDFATVARRVVEQAIGETLTGEPIEKKDAAAVARGKKGGKAGGRARADVLTKERRSQIAKKAAHARWDESDESSD